MINILQKYQDQKRWEETSNYHRSKETKELNGMWDFELNPGLEKKKQTLEKQNLIQSEYILDFSL